MNYHIIAKNERDLTIYGWNFTVSVVSRYGNVMNFHMNDDDDPATIEFIILIMVEQTKQSSVV